MRLFFFTLVIMSLQLRLAAQAPPPPADTQHAAESRLVDSGTPPAKSTISPVQRVKTMVKREVNHALMANPYPALDQWQPLSARQKFQVFVVHTYAPMTFANAGIDAVKDKLRADDREYERGLMGLGQHYGINLATSETNVFFERFFFPTLLKQDPRYFRNPDLPFFKRALYSISRVVITRSDSGHATFNASKVLGGATSQALSDLYVPGHAQGMGPIRDRVTFDLLRDAGMNLVHEFWPDMRRKIFHR